MNKNDTKNILKNIENILVPKYANISPGWADLEYQNIKEEPWNYRKATEHINFLISEFSIDLEGKIDRLTIPES